MEGRALSPDMLCRDSEEPACRGDVLPDPAPTEVSGAAPGSPEYFSREAITVQARPTGRVVRAGRLWRTFCRHGTNIIEHYACRGTSKIGAANLSPVTKLVACTGAVSRRRP